MIAALDVLRLFGGFVYLVLGGDLLVRGALALSRRTSISPVLIGLTVVALGTSAPELVISVYGAFAGYTDIALGNVIGSNIANIFLVLGVPALISPIVAESTGLSRQTGLMIGITLLFIAFAWGGTVSRIEGLVLLGMLVAFLIATWKFGSHVTGVELVDEAEQLERVLGLPHNTSVAIGFVILGIVMLPVGADLTVEGAVAIARGLHVPEIVIASTVIALGTSLPELSTTVIAAFHKSSDIALGNVIGSNMFNILLVGGAAATVAPLQVPDSVMSFDLWVMLLASLALLPFVLRHWPISRMAGGLFVAAYCAYVVLLV